MKRREFSAKIAQSAAGVIFIPATTTDAFQDSQYVRTLAERASGMRQEVGGVPLIPSLMGQVQRVERALHGKDRELQSAASHLANETMLALYDAQRFREAERIGALSLALARRANDFPAQAGAYTILSQISTYQGMGARGAMYAEQALHLPDLSNANQAYVKIRIGRALSLVPGRERKARAMLDEALGMDGVPAFKATDIAGNAAIALDRLRLHREALSTFDETVARMGQWSSLYQAQYLAHQAKAALHARELSLAADLMNTLAKALPILSSARLRQLAADVFSTSTPWATVPEIHEARQHLHIALSQGARPTKT